jgi:hypothetical protein
MLRHKAMIQCARVAFSLAGIFDPDEAERVADVGDEKPGITRPTRASVQTIDAPQVSAAPSQKEEAKVEVAPVFSSSCFCACCKNGKCTCTQPGIDEFTRCGCAACKQAVAEVSKATPRPTDAPVEQATAQDTSVASDQPSGAELFPQQGQPSKPAGPYITNKQVTKLVIAAKASGVDIKKDSHDDVIHNALQQRYGIVSLTEIPAALFDEILSFASNAGPVKVNAK